MSTPISSIPAPANSTALAIKAPKDIRNELTEMVIRDLLGPAGDPNEELNQYEDHAYQRYLVGMLAPRGSEVAGEELDELATGDGDEDRKSTRLNSSHSRRSRMPSSA